MVFAADVAKTDEGYKIVELNPGAASGYLDANFMKEKGIIPHLKSIILNNKYYRELTGRKSPLMAAGAATGAAGAGLSAGTAAAYARELKKEKERKEDAGSSSVSEDGSS